MDKKLTLRLDEVLLTEIHAYAKQTRRSVNAALLVLIESGLHEQARP